MEEIKRLEPRVILFMSADVKDSTKAKREAYDKGIGGSWFKTIIALFEDAPTFLRGAADERAKTKPTACKPEAPSVWKIVGDEVVFFVHLRHVDEVAFHLLSFHDYLIQASEASGTKLKGTAWIAGFPVANRPVKVDGTDGEDFLGPSMDLGFRLTRFATDHRLVITADLAWLLLTSDNNQGRIIEQMYCSGLVELKGITNGVGYPLFWLAVKEDAGSFEIAFAREVHGAEKRIKQEIADYIFSHGCPKHLPFIPGCSVTGEKNKPIGYEKEYAAVCSELNVGDLLPPENEDGVIQGTVADKKRKRLLEGFRGMVGSPPGARSEPEARQKRAKSKQQANTAKKVRRKSKQKKKR